MDPSSLTPAERVALLIKKLGVTTYQFGKATGISHQTLSNVLTGKNKPGLDTLQAIAAVYPAAAIFLLTGQGEPFPDGVRGLGAPASNAEEPTPAKAAPAMAVNIGVDEMTDAQRADFYKLYYERTKQKLAVAEQTIAHLTEAQEHAEVVQLVARAGGRSFNDASADAADTTDTPPVMVAETNHEYVERAAEAERNRVGFVYGLGR